MDRKIWFQGDYLEMKDSKFIRLKNSIKKIEHENMFVLRCHRLFIGTLVKVMGPERFTKLKYKNRMGKSLDLKNPKQLNEKIQWLKLYYFQDFYRTCCDKYLIREYMISKFGQDYAPELLFVSKRVNDFSLSKIKKFPCILKISNGSGQNIIINNKNEYTDDDLIKKIRLMIYEANIHASFGCEPQYLPKEPYIVVEKLLQDKDGKLPNDYKLMYINGNLEYIYCSVDRMGLNVRHLYDKNWNRIDAILLENATEQKYREYMATKSIARPDSLDKMIGIGDVLAKDFPLVRLDFYDVDGDVYIGEITLHHGGGFDRFYPEKYDEIFGEKLKLPEKNFELKI